MRFIINITYKVSWYFLNFTLQKRIFKTQCWNWLLTPPPTPPATTARMSTFLTSLYRVLIPVWHVGAFPFWMIGEEGWSQIQRRGLPFFPPCRMFGKKSWCQPLRRDLLSPQEDQMQQLLVYYLLIFLLSGRGKGGGEISRAYGLEDITMPNIHISIHPMHTVKNLQQI